MYQNWHREFVPNVGRYLQSDPIQLYGGLNLYSYANDRPIMVSDRMGLIGAHESFRIPGNPNPVYPPVPINCKRDYWERVKKNWLDTRKGLPGPIGAPGIPFITGGEFGRASVGFTTRDAVVGMYRGGLTTGAATLTRLEIAAGAAGAGIANVALATLAFESGLGIGSLIAAGIMPCEEEEDMCDQ